MSDTKIHVLPPALCNQIAAGEVLERAASAVKELVENSLDAGANAIEIEIEEGGRKRLSVTDNGCGMTKEDARLSVIRHATSKIASVEDLARIGTMGFRGEALASMASVSKLTILTRRPEDDAGTCLKIEGTVEVSCRECAAPVGTQITIEELFFNTPARLKFLRTPATEQRRIYEVVEAFSLACPEVSFKLVIDGRVKCDYPANRSLRERAHAVFGRSLYDHLYDIVPYSLQDVSVSGVYCSPDYIQSASGRLYMYVNHRSVKDRTIQSAIMQAYKEFLHGKQPCAIVFVNLPLDQVDVNVHPTKSEIRFVDQDVVFRAVHRAIRQSLEKTPWIRSPESPAPSDYLAASNTAPPSPASPASEAAIFEAPAGTWADRAANAANRRFSASVTALPASAFESPERAIRASLGVPDPTIRHDRKPAPDAAAVNLSAAPAGSFGDDGLAFCDDDIAFDPSSPANPQSEGAQSQPGGAEPGAPAADAGAAPVPELRLIREKALEGIVSAAVPQELPLEYEKPKGYFSSLRYLGQIALTYLICSDHDNLVVIDQHAAHERINYERLRSVADHILPATPQGLLFPMLIELDTRLSEVLDEFMDFFTSLGFQIDAIGQNKFALRVIPHELDGYDHSALLREALTELAETGRSDQFEQIRNNIIATMACHKSIRAGDRISAEEARHLFREMDETAFRSNCPHGRPVHFILSQAEIEKRFLRT